MIIAMVCNDGPGFPVESVIKNPPANAGDTHSIPGWGRFPGEGNRNPLQYSCLENPMDRESWWAIVHRVTNIRTRLSNSTKTTIIMAQSGQNCVGKTALSHRLQRSDFS